MIAYGLRVLRLPPDQFWQLTPREFAALLPPSGVAPRRAELDRLMAGSPDPDPPGHRRDDGNTAAGGSSNDPSP